ncbi:unnamed protein product [Sphacelaria rigidula]
MTSAATKAGCAALLGLSISASHTSAFTSLTGVIRPRSSTVVRQTTTTNTNANPTTRQNAWVGRSSPVVVAGAQQQQHGRRSANMPALQMSTAEAGTDTTAVVDEGEKFEFQAEVGRVMDIIINSLYSNRDVFLRELISNAADACDKKRFLAVTDDTGGASGQPEYRIRVRADKDSNSLIIEDSGVGMTKEELKNNLGRIAESGTAKFMDAIKQGDADVSLIGQFGVGFYSGFLVADKVTVYTKSCQSPDATQYRWQSGESNSYTIAEDDSDPIEGSGTRIVLHLKEDSEEYLDDFKIKELCTRYSEFISFPIEVWAEKTTYDQVPDPDAEVEEGGEPKMKTVTRTAMQWELMNKMKPIWMRSPREVKEEEYSEFYKSTFKAWDELATYTHFSLEGQVEFRALLFVPSVLPYELSRNMFDETSRNMRLYVKRVFINDKFEELIPRWLLFLRGVVDSEDLPLNVGREILQRSKMLSVISKRLVRKSIDMFKKLAEDEEKYKTFWENFGKYLKVGIVEDEDVKDDLAQLCRFFSRNTGEDLVSLEQYIADMKEEQKAIYYVTADSRESALMSPALEKAAALGFDVLFMTEPLDELTVQAIGEFKGKTLTDLGKENVDLGEDEEDKAKQNDLAEETQGFRQWLSETLGEKRVAKVEISSRLVDSPATLVQGAYGMSPTMARYMRAQAVAFGEKDSTMTNNQQAVLEINVGHPVISSLQKSFEIAPDSDETKQTAMLLYDIAALTGGYSIDDPGAFAKRVTGMLAERIVGDEGESGGVADAEVVA